MPLLRSLSHTTTRCRRRRRRRQSSIVSPLAILVSCCYLLLHLLSEVHQSPYPILLAVVQAGESTIPRSTNRYSNYNRQSSPASISSSTEQQQHDYVHPPWNPSPKIDSHGFLTNLYPRIPGEWERMANIRGKYGPRSRTYPQNLVSIPVEVRQVPGDGNCLFHSIAACLHYTEKTNEGTTTATTNKNGRHLPMDSHERILELRSKSLELRNAAVDVLHNVNTKGRRKLFLQGDEYLEARELLAAAAAQFELDGEEYCELMRKESYWGGGPEIVALCNYLQRPIHIYELVPTTSKNNNKHEQTRDDNDTTTTTPTSNIKHAKTTCTQFTLRRMACFGSPRYDRREPLHILSADSRFPDVEPKRIRRVGNHFLALFPVTQSQGVLGGGGGFNQFRNHALLRGGSRNNAVVSHGEEVKEEEKPVVQQTKRNRSVFKWDGGRGKFDNDNEAEEQ